MFIFCANQLEEKIYIFYVKHKKKHKSHIKLLYLFPPQNAIYHF